MLPGEADAAVDLDVLGRGVEVRVGAVRLGQAGRHRQLLVVLAGCPRGVVGGRLARLDLEQHVGALVLDRLERADRAAELDAHLGVLDRHLEHLLRTADHLVGRHRGGLVEGLRQCGPAGPRLAERRGRHVGELELGLLAGLVHGRERGAGETGGAGVDREERDAVLAGRALEAGGHDDEVGGVAVDHEHLGAVERVAVARALGHHLDAVGVPLAVGLGEREGGDGLAAGDAGEQLGLLVVGTGVDDGVGREHDGGEVGRAEQHPTHLLHHDAELHEREALAAELLGDVKALEAELVGHLAPHRGVVALGGLHEPAHLGGGRLRLEEATDGVAQLLLLVGEGEVHG